MKKLFLAVTLPFFVAGCGQDQEEPLVFRTVLVDRILMHERGHFTFLVQHEEGRVGQLEIQTSCRMAVIASDVPPGHRMWVSYTCTNGYGGETTCKTVPPIFSSWIVSGAWTLYIHAHTIKEIDGAGWNHGKHGSGQTVIVE